jgi:DNA-binding transcriptional MerR regulator
MDRIEQDSPSPATEVKAVASPSVAAAVAGAEPARASRGLGAETAKEATAGKTKPASRALSRTDSLADHAGGASGGVEGAHSSANEARTEVRVPVGVASVSSLPPIPAKRYFTIGEVSDLCGVKPYVLRYWEQEFSQLRPMKRRGNRRYYQHHEVLLIRRIRELLYEQGFTISGARNQLQDHLPAAHAAGADAESSMPALALPPPLVWRGPDLVQLSINHPQAAAELREALVSIRDLLA